ncbi:YceH family protein [Marinomonas mediterranea]|jgi:Uncharacterized protein conserved in bacteria|uniref:UPF0502 protein yceH n=1 Tax=Marinomonas mediterranea (strain ATCC 700492 / JCM 21426 / NBRC 103028 / MMB-1) TaxID=717774 RepID=F2K492_MARM1|nr:YceH family protein [Marinomonas mediterranea]ADZ92533.1 UPF0502 protein yceH [Marinomonas mediterranea MMB-1]WCN18578.1 DUF480 domain-containing protein [Marinomonas mediterranea MMB-1]
MSYYELNPMEARVIGCLIEKSITTPEQYPLSLNALVNACNQKSSRDPVVNYSELDVQDTIETLVERALITEVTLGSRVAKYQHRFCNTEFSDLQFSAGETAVVCLQLLRGAQTPGEIRSRSGRLHTFSSLHEVDEALANLKEMTGGPFIEMLPKEPGRRERRFQSTLCLEREAIDASLHEAESTTSTTQSNNATRPSLPDAIKRIDELESKLAELTERLETLEQADRL